MGIDKIKTAQELDIRWPELKCPYSPTGNHYFIARSNISRGSIWVCKHCSATKWLPLSWVECSSLSMDMMKYGILKAYWMCLDRRPRLRELLVKLQDIRVLRERLPNQRLLKVIVEIVADHTLEYRKELEDEGMVLRRREVPLEVYPDII